MKIISVVGARPNFMKIAPFIRAIKQYNETLSPSGGGGLQDRGRFSPAGGGSRGWIAHKEDLAESKQLGTSPMTNDQSPIQHLLVHTGQHYDDRMSRAFFEALNIPDADINLGIGSGTHAEQVGQTMIEFEKVLEKEKPDWVVVVGDVNATLACSVTAKKLHVKVCHIEAGLRSRDMKMPEEINRLVTDRLSDLLLTPDRLSGKNLLQEGISENNIVFVGNIMIDTLEANREKAGKLSVSEIIENNALSPSGGGSRGRFSSSGRTSHLVSNTKQFSPFPPAKAKRRTGRGVKRGHALLTLHRPSNVDQKEVLQPIVDFLANEITRDMPVIWPIHPRSEKRLKEFGLWEKVINNPGMILLHPIGYHEMLKLNMEALIILTDSGGLQEESTVLGTPCLTLRWNTERPITLREHGGASVLVGNNVERIRKEYHETLNLTRKPQRPELWDGKTAGRCVEAIVNWEKCEEEKLRR